MNLRKFRENLTSEKNTGRYRFVKVDGVMIKIDTNKADTAFEAAMRVHRSRRN